MEQSEVEGIPNQTSRIPRSQFKGVELSGTTNSNSKHYIHSTFNTRSSLLGDVTSSPAAERFNDANIEDMWVPYVLWLWTAYRIRYVLTLSSSNRLNPSV